MPPDHLSPVSVEVLLLSERDGCLRYRQLKAGLPAGTHPDDTARILSGLTPCVSGAVLHSTSWRHADGGLVLTYAALPDLQAADTRPVWADASAAGVPLAPSPSDVDIDAVVAHACRHLALLAHTDPGIGAVMPSQPVLWELLSKLAPGIPGGLQPAQL